MKTSIIYILTKNLKRQIFLLVLCSLFTSMYAQTGSRLIGYGTYDYTAGSWYNVDSLKFAWYNNFGGDEDHTTSTWNLTSRESIQSSHVAIIYGYKDFYTYNANNQVVSSTLLGWDGSVYQNSSRSIDSFDIQGRKVQSISEIWSAGAWLKYRLSINTFDSNNLIISTDVKAWNTGTSVWEPYQIFTSAYNTGGKRTLYQSISYTGTNWVNQDKLEDTYDLNNNLLTQTQYTGSGSIWVNDKRWSHQYDVNNNETIYTYYSWNTGTSTWKNIWRALYSYNTNNLKTDWTYQTYSTVWDNVYKYTFTYNAADLRETATRQNWTSSAWINTSKTINQYNANGFLLEERIQTWDGSAWIDATKNTYIRNSFDQRTLTKTESYSVGAWNITQEKYNYYEAYSPVTGVEDISGAGSLKAYPNPFVLNCMIEFESAGFGKHLIQVFDLSGRLIKQAEEYFPGGTNNWLFDGKDNTGNEIAKGLYIVKIENGTQKFIQKISKI